MLGFLLGTVGLVVQTIILSGLFAVGIWFLIYAVRQTLYWPRASAEVLRYWITRSEGKPNGQRFFHPVLRIRTADGRIATTISSWGSWRRPWPVGQTIPIRYDPLNPQRMQIACFANLWALPLIFLGLPFVYLLTRYLVPRLMGIPAL